MSSETQAPTKTYRGNCHCGAFVYEAEIPEIKSAMQCGCSICFKKGYLLIFTPASTVKIVKGALDDLTTYEFGSKKISHMFCPKCGVSAIGKGDTPNGTLYALNVHCIQGMDTHALEKTPAGGEKIGPEHVVPEYSGPEPTAEIEGSKMYYGSCHCGAVTFALRSKPIDKNYDGFGPVAPISECTCSICERYGVVWIYPKKDQLVIQGWDSITDYTFNSGMVLKSFCKKCGVLIANKFKDLTQDEMDKLDEATRAFAKANDLYPVNIRALNNFTLDELDIKVVPGHKHGTPYVNP